MDFLNLVREVIAIVRDGDLSLSNIIRILQMLDELLNPEPLAGSTGPVARTFSNDEQAALCELCAELDVEVPAQGARFSAEFAAKGLFDGLLKRLFENFPWEDILERLLWELLQKKNS